MLKFEDCARKLSNKKFLRFFRKNFKIAQIWRLIGIYILSLSNKMKQFSHSFSECCFMDIYALERLSTHMTSSFPLFILTIERSPNKISSIWFWAKRCRFIQESEVLRASMESTVTLPKARLWLSEYYYSVPLIVIINHKAGRSLVLSWRSPLMT